MKSYEERLPLIDAAIEQGLKEEDGDAVFFGRYLRRFYFGFISRNSASADYICTRDEFEKRKAELAAKEQDMNDWYEKGELPPVGSVVRHKESGKDVEVKCHLRTGQAIGERLCHPLIEIGFASDFEPLRTETDKLVEQMERSFESTGCVFTNDHRALAEHLIEQGYRKIKPMSEQEFMKQCVDICGHGDARLYRAGCRFVEQVKA